MDIQKEHVLETYKFLMQLGLETLRISFLLNGGAVIAILAYLGNLSKDNETVPDFRLAAGFFLGGLILSGFSFVSAYIMQLDLYNESSNRRPDGSHICLLWVSIILIILSIFSFAIGSFSAVWSF